MNASCIKQEISAMITNMHSLDTAKQIATINEFYDPDCRLQNPYMILTKRYEISSLFASLANQNTELSADIHSIVYDPILQVATVNLYETINPKALGGLLPIKIHQILKLQLEISDNEELGNLLYVTDHNEVHTYQEYISRLPVLGSWYDGSIREVMGKLVLTGSSILDATGILDYVPGYVETAITAACTTRDTVAGVAGDALAVGQSVLDSTGARVGHYVEEVTDVGLRVANATGVSSIYHTAGSAVVTVADAAESAVSSASDSASILLQFARQTAFVVKLRAAQYVENVEGRSVNCYAPTCVPGIKCYSPTCIRNKPEGGFSPRDVVGCIYKEMVKARQ